MGSIRAFPKRARAGTIADVWRMAPMPGPGLVHVRVARQDDFPAAHALQRLAHPQRPALSMKQLESQRHHFAEGQLVAERSGQVVGIGTSLVLDWERHLRQPTRAALTDGETFATHDPLGDTLLAVDTVVDLARRGMGVGRALLQARRQLCRRLNLRRIVAVVPLTGYAARQASMPAELFAMRVVMDDLPDPVLRFHIAQGFQYCGLARDYDPADIASAGHAALLAWVNPLYTPPPRPAREGDRWRECA